MLKYFFTFTFCVAAVCCSAQITFQKKYPGSGGAGRMMQQTMDGGYIISGRVPDIGAGARDIYLLKTDASGNVTWANAYGAVANEHSFSVLQTADGGYATVAWTNSFSGPDSAFK